MVSTTTTTPATAVPSRLAADAAALADGVVPLSAAAAAGFLAAHPLPAIVEQLRVAPPQVAATVARALEKVLATDAGAALLPVLLQEEDAATGPIGAAAAAASPALRGLAAAILARALPADPGRAVPHLARLLTDPDSAVAGAAEAALARAARAGGAGAAPLLGGGGPLAGPLASPDATVRARGLAVSAALLSSADPATAAAARAAGALAPLAAELDGDDPLTAAAALAAVAAAAAAAGEGGSGDPSAASALVDALGTGLASLIDRGGSLFAPVWAQAVNAAAVLLSAAAGGRGGDDGGRGTPAAALASSLAAALDAHLGEASTEDDAVREGAAVEAAGALGASSAGAGLLVGRAPAALAGLACRALGARGGGGGGGTAARVAALHALASLAGAERVRPSHPGAALVGGGRGGGEEAVLAAAIHAGAADGRPPGATPAAAFSALTAQPLDDVRVAALRCLLPLVAARPWAAADVAAHPELLGRLTAARPWAGSPPAEWRHAAVLALERSARAALCGSDDGLAPEQRAALASALPALVAAARAGAHGFGARDMVQQEVATRAG